MEEKRNEESHVTKSLATGKAVEKSKLEKAVGVFLAEDIDAVKGSIVSDYIKPKLMSTGKEFVRRGKESIADIANGVVETILFGDPKKRNQGSSGTYNGQRVNYISYYNNQDRGYSGYGSHDDYYGANRRPDPVTRLRKVAIPSYGQAKMVLDELIFFTKKYPAATVADYYQLVEMPTCKEDFQFGWKNLDNASIIHTRDGYIIDLPKPIPID